MENPIFEDIDIFPLIPTSSFAEGVRFERNQASIPFLLVSSLHAIKGPLDVFVVTRRCG